MMRYVNLRFTLHDPNQWLQPFFIHHWTNDRRGIAPYTLALQHRYQHKHINAYDIKQLYTLHATVNHADRLSCDIRTASLSISESADNINTRCPDLSRPMKSFSVKYTQDSELNKHQNVSKQQQQQHISHNMSDSSNKSDTRNSHYETMAQNKAV